MLKIYFSLIFFCTIQFSFAQSSWQWVTAAPDTGNSNLARKIFTDPAGNSVITGSFKGKMTVSATSFLVSNGGKDIYAIKYDALGSPIWAFNFGSTTDDEGMGVSGDAQGNIYLTGYFTGTANFGGLSATSAGGADIFVLKLDINGVAQWVERAGGNNSTLAEGGNAIVSDWQGNTYVTGYFYGTNVQFGTVPGISSGNYSNFFVAKYNSVGVAQWSNGAGGNGTYNLEEGTAVSIDTVRNTCIVGGDFFSNNIIFAATDTLVNNQQTGGATDAFIVQYNATSGAYLRCQHVSGYGYNYIRGIAIDKIGNIYYTGFYETQMVKPASMTNYSEHVFVLKIDSLNHVFWSRKMGANSNGQDSYGIVLDSSANAYVTGWFRVAFHAGSYVINSSAAGAFVFEIDSAGTVLALTGGICNGNQNSGARSIGIDADASVYIVGVSAASTTFGTQTLNATRQDVYIAKYGTQVFVNAKNIFDENLNLFPNPANELVMLKLKSNASATTTVIDILGKVISNQKTNNENISINTSALSNGIYFVSVVQNGSKITERLVVNH